MNGLHTSDLSILSPINFMQRILLRNGLCHTFVPEIHSWTKKSTVSGKCALDGIELMEPRLRVKYRRKTGNCEHFFFLRRGIIYRLLFVGTNLHLMSIMIVLIPYYDSLQVISWNSQRKWICIDVLY